MSEITDLKTFRGKTQERCDYCGAPEHDGVFACKRIRSITYNNETDEVTLRFWGDHEEPAPPEAA